MNNLKDLLKQEFPNFTDIHIQRLIEKYSEDIQKMSLLERKLLISELPYWTTIEFLKSMHQGSLKNAVYNSNPFLKMIPTQHSFEGAYIPVPFKTQD